MRFIEWKWSFLTQIPLNVVLYGPIKQVNIRSGYGLASNRRQAITCNNDDPVHRHISAGFNELTYRGLNQHARHW